MPKKNASVWSKTRAALAARLARATFVADGDGGDAAREALRADPSIQSDVIDAWDVARHRYTNRDDVAAVDIGYARVGGAVTADVCVRVHVREKFALHHLEKKAVFARDIDGVRVDVVDRDPVPHGRGRHAVLSPGVSISHQQGSAGSLGMFAVTRSGEPCLVSAGHVLVPNNFASGGDPIAQPAIEDGAALPGDRVARLGPWSPQLDVATALLTGARGVAPAFVGLGNPHLGRRLRKRGRSIDVVDAVVDGVGGSFRNVAGSFSLCAIAGGAWQISLPGDSGAVWFDASSDIAVGVHVEGARVATPGTDFASAVNVREVFRVLDLGFLPP